MLPHLMQALLPLKRPVALLVLLVMAGLVGGQFAGAQVAPGEPARVEVRAVKFSQIRAPGGGDTWSEAAVELGITPATDGGVYARWADGVRVTLSLSVRKRNGDFEFYRADAEAVSLESGRAVFRFYLPPEISRREQTVGAEPYAFAVDLSVAGKPVNPTATQVSSVIASPEALRSFKDRVARSATTNDGILVPQFDSPFAHAFAGDTPTFVRR